jgi:hypothetical protein
MKLLTNRWLAVFLISSLLLGCAAPDPQRTYVGKSNDAKLIVRSANMPMNVAFSVSSSTKSCEGFERIGTVRDSGRGVLLPWIANLTERASRVPVEQQAAIPAEQVIQVKGYGHWMDSGGNGRCGPLVAKFSVDPGTTYLVEFVWAGTSACSMRVSDISVATEVRPVPFERGFCRPPTLFGY